VSAFGHKSTFGTLRVRYRPLKIVAFNTVDGWSHDMTSNVATKLLDLNRDGVQLSAAVAL